MKQTNKLLRFIKWFFEEKNPESEEVEGIDSDINIGPLQITLIILMTGMLLVWVFFEPIKAVFNKPAQKASEYIEANIEKNYFSANPVLKNNDFSNGLEHWVTSDGGKLFPDSKSIASIETSDFHSAPASMKIECIAPASRYHYSKKPNNNLVNNAYSYKESLYWMGVVPGAKIKGSLWYKGDIIKFAVNYLKIDGEWGNLANVSGAASSQWSQLEINEKVPFNARAIMLEITLNQAQGATKPVVLVDDINVDVQNNEKKL